MKKKIISLILTAVMAISLTACGNAASGSAEAANAGGAKDTGSSGAAGEGGTYTVGISQFAEHGSLDNCREGFLAGLAGEGFVEGENLTVLYDNAQADMGTASTIADNFVARKADLICAVATPSAMSAYNACMENGIPVIYTAVSDPVEAGLAGEDGSSVGNVTGTSDALPVSAQLQMIRSVLPEAKTIGILYTTSEANSESTIAEYKKYAAEYGFEILDSGVNTIADVPLAAADLASRADCITNLTDNTVVSALQTVLDAAAKEGIPVFGSEVEQVKNGCVASMGLDYYELGRRTGRMAAKVLRGEAEAASIPYEVVSEAALYVNTAAADKIGLVLEEGFTAGAYQVFDEIIVD